MTHTVTYELERNGDTLELIVEYTMSRYIPAQTYGPPEHCSPEEGGEIEDLDVTLGGEPFVLTAHEQAALERWIYDTHDAAADDDGYDDYDDFGGFEE